MEEIAWQTKMIWRKFFTIEIRKRLSQLHDRRRTSNVGSKSMLPL